MEGQNSSATKRNIASTIIWRLGEFFFVLQLWFIANLHRAEEWVGRIEFARFGFKFFDWTGWVLHVLDDAIEALKFIDDKLFYALLDFLLGLVNIAASHATEDWVFIVFGSFYVAWASGTKIYGAALRWRENTSILKKVGSELEADSSIIGGTILGLVVGGPIGALVGGIWGLIYKEDLKGQVKQAGQAALESQSFLKSTIYGAPVAIGIDLLIKYGLPYIYQHYFPYDVL